MHIMQCDEGLQSSFLDTFRRVLEESTANQASCVAAGLLSLLLDWFGEEQDEGLMTKVAHLMQMIGGHSITGKDIRRIFSLLRSTKDGCRPRHGALLLNILQGMLIGEGPTAFFELSGRNSVSMIGSGNSSRCLSSVSFVRAESGVVIIYHAYFGLILSSLVLKRAYLYKHQFAGQAIGVSHFPVGQEWSPSLHLTKGRSIQT